MRSSWQDPFTTSISRFGVSFERRVVELWLSAMNAQPARPCAVRAALLRLVRKARFAARPEREVRGKPQRGRV